MPLPSFSQRLKYAATAYLIQKCLIWPMETIGTIKRDYLGFGPADTKPDLIKRFPVRRGLPVRIFLPSSVSSSTSNQVKLPLLFTIHGGGFVIGSPPDNDAWNRSFAERHSHIVIALNYAKAPGSPFPGPVNDLEALTIAILSAPTTDLGLPAHISIDTSRVSIAGLSAGGNLSLALCHRLSSSPSFSTLGITISAVIPIYPVLDFTTPVEIKTRLRQYKPSLGGFRGKPTDYLTAMAPVFNWAYIHAGENLKNPELSPFFVEQDKLPKNVFVVGCELDLLGHEAWRFANRLAGREVPRLEEKIGREEVAERGKVLVKGDSEEKFGWERQLDGGRRIKWLLVPDTVHGFDQDLAMLVGGDKEILEDAKLKTEELIGVIGDWLADGWKRS
ncbi:Alpha/Beta hydrolase fold [Naviculisporaceae sp. PSN 640]